jgi:hypothetical protein
MRREHRYYVYMMQSSFRRALYIAMTNHLHPACVPAQNPGMRRIHRQL